MNLIFFVFCLPKGVFVWLSPACGVLSFCSCLYGGFKGFEEKLKRGFKASFKGARFSPLQASSCGGEHVFVHFFTAQSFV